MDPPRLAAIRPGGADCGRLLGWDMLGGMVVILVIDPDPTYRAYWHLRQGADAVCTLDAALAYIESSPPYDKIIVSSRLLDCIPELVRRGCRVEVATATPTVVEAVAAYRAGARNYFTKSF